MCDMARRLSSTQYVLIGILFGTCVYLWTRKLTDGGHHPAGKMRSFKVVHNAPAEDVENMIDKWIDDQDKADTKPESEDDGPVEAVADDEVPLRDKSNAPLAASSLEIDNNIDDEEASKSDKKDQQELPAPDDGPKGADNIGDSLLSSSDLNTGDDAVAPAAVPPTSDDTVSKVVVVDDDVAPIEPFPSSPLPLADDKNKTLELLDLWNFDDKCDHYQVGLLKDNSLEPRALVSFPGSGNSWLRMLLMGLSGAFIHSVYAGDDSQFQSKANSTYNVPVNCGCTLLQKSHDFSLDAMLYYLPPDNRTHVLNEFNGKGLLILRNPFRAIRSYRNFDSGGMQGKAPPSAFVGKEWDDFVGRSVVGWETLATVWIRGLKQGGIVYYEKLRHETEAELGRIAKMLGLPTDKGRFDCVVRHANDNSFKRETHKFNNTEPYTTSQRLLIRKSIDRVQAELKQRRLDPLPVQYYELYDVMPEFGLRDSEGKSPVI